MPANGKSYTQVLIDVYEKMDRVEQRLIKRLDGIQDNTAATVAIALDATERIHGSMNKRIDDNTDDIKKTRNLNITIATVLSAIAAWLGWGN